MKFANNINNISYKVGHETIVLQKSSRIFFQFRKVQKSCDLKIEDIGWAKQYLFQKVLN